MIVVFPIIEAGHVQHPNFRQLLEDTQYPTSGNTAQLGCPNGRGTPKDHGLYHARSDTNGLSWSPDGNVLASAHQDGKVRLWETETAELIQTIDAHKGWARGVSWSLNGKFVVSGAGAYEESHIGATMVWQVL